MLVLAGQGSSNVNRVLVHRVLSLFSSGCCHHFCYKAHASTNLFWEMQFIKIIYNKSNNYR